MNCCPKCQSELTPKMYPCWCPLCKVLVAYDDINGEFRLLHADKPKEIIFFPETLEEFSYSLGT